MIILPKTNASGLSQETKAVKKSGGKKEIDALSLGQEAISLFTRLLSCVLLVKALIGLGLANPVLADLLKTLPNLTVISFNYRRAFLNLSAYVMQQNNKLNFHDFLKVRSLLKV